MYQVSCLIVRLEAGTLRVWERHYTLPSLSFSSSTVMPTSQPKAWLQQRIHGWIWPQSLIHPFGFPGTKKSLCDGIASVTKLDCHDWECLLASLCLLMTYFTVNSNLTSSECEFKEFTMATRITGGSTWHGPFQSGSLVTGKAQAEA